MIDTTMPFGVKMPPTQKNLPSDDGKPMETQRHKMQMEILIETLYPWLEKRSDGYVGGNMFLYFSLAQVRNQDFQGPDFFAVLDVPKGERLSWVVWEEGKAPNVIIELLSPSTVANDKMRKKLTYQNDVRVPEYFWFDPFNPNDLSGFRLDNGTYQAIATDSDRRLISQQLQLALVRWQGVYGGVNTVWLRWQTLDGELLPTSYEHAVMAEIKAQGAETFAREAVIKAQDAEAKAQEAIMKAQEAEIKAQEMEKRSQDLENILQQYRDRYGDSL
jgi:Uma2 family endonuclease